MTVKGFEDYWVAGTRWAFQEDPKAGVIQPLVDFGIIESSTPTISTEKLELKDTDGGRRSLADETLVDATESYDIACRNFNKDNLRYLFLADVAVNFTQAVVQKDVATWCTPGRLVKLTDADADKTWLYGITAIIAAYTGTTTTTAIKPTGTAIDVATKKIVLTGDKTAVAGLAPGKVFFVNIAGLTNILNARSYTVVTRTLVSTDTELVVLESPAANEVTLVGATVTHENAGTIYKQDIDWEAKSPYSRGIVRFIPAGAFAVAGNLQLVFATGALSGKRLLYPQSQKGGVTGKAALYISRGGNIDQDVRECNVSITPAAPNITVDDYSTLNLQVKVLSDLTKAITAGRLLHFAGAVASSS